MAVTLLAGPAPAAAHQWGGGQERVCIYRQSTALLQGNSYGVKFKGIYVRSKNTHEGKIIALRILLN